MLKLTCSKCGKPWIETTAGYQASCLCDSYVSTIYPDESGDCGYPLAGEFVLGEMRATWPYKCPVCEGRGQVPSGFYTNTTGSWAIANFGNEVCRSCQGTGVIWK